MSSSMRVAVLSIALVGGPAWGLSELRIGGPEGNDWEDLARAEGGRYVVVDGQGQILRTVGIEAVPYAPVPDEEIRDWGEIVMLDFSGNGMRPVFIEPTQNLALPDERRVLYVTSSISTGYTDAESRSVAPAVDGDPTTAFLRPVPESPRLAGLNLGWVKNLVVNLGAEMPVNRVRFYPRPGFEESYLAWYELGGVPEESVIVDRAGTRRPGKRWFRDISRTLGAPNDPAVEVIRRETENLEALEDVTFPTQDFRWVTLRPLNPERDWEIAEFEIYGEGYVTRTRYRTDILDMGHPVTWSKVRWAGERPERTRVRIRTRTGNTPQPFRYALVDRTGRFSEVDRTEYNNVFGAGAYSTVKREVDVESWSFWSPEYDWEAGLRNPDERASAWEDGQRVLSPSPTRYLQLEVELFADRDVAPRIDQLEVLFSEVAAASEVVGEVWPIVTDDFGSQTFTYVVRPVIGPEDGGFDRLEIVTHIQADTVRSVIVDGVEVIDRFRPEVLEDRIVVSFDRLAGTRDSEKRIEVVFDTRVLRFGSDFTGFVWSSDQPAVRQRVDPGDATFRFGGNVLSVETPMGGELISDARILPRVFTPNGDGRNDRVRIVYDVRDIAADRPHVLEIFDLTGRRVHRLDRAPRSSGTFEQEWDGRDDEDRLVAPGIYVLRIEVEADTGRRVVNALLSVAY